MSKQRRTKREGYQLILDYKSSKQSVTACCSATGISKPVFYYWKKRSQNTNALSPRFYPVSIKEPSSDCLSGVRLHYPNGVQIEIASEINLDTLEHLIQLGQCSH
ncbi:MAG: hypothetical protein LBU22_05520 [Dysgonamonadaceae bacterium]|jgi:hypothetical protein|nr:hypothetical protein [Dysgonamonadaceae bacterium]